MSSKASQPENFNSTAKLMLEALAKASAELEKSVTAFTEQLISFNEGVQKSLEEELRAINIRLESCLRSNLDELGHNKHLFMKRLLEAERAELDRLSDCGRQVRVVLSENAAGIEQKIEDFVNAQIQELKEFLEKPQAQIEDATADARLRLDQAKGETIATVSKRQQDFRKHLSDKVLELERNIKSETEKAREAIVAVSDFWSNSLKSERESFCQNITAFGGTTIEEIENSDTNGNASLQETEEVDRAALEDVGDRWRQQVNQHADAFNRLIGGLSSVLKENYETKLSNVADQARQEINMLSEQAHEKIAATRNELEVELRELEKEYIHELEDTLRKLEAIVSGHANDKRNSTIARQHKSQKARDQMRAHLKRWGGSLVDSIKDAASDLENEFVRATDGFLVRIDSARASAIELLERESKLMQKDLERVLKEFQRELNEQEIQISKIENAGQDAVVTVIACRKAMLSFKGE
jgi:hypothetical protein